MTFLRFANGFQSCSKLSALALFLVGATAGGAAQADPLGAGAGTLFRLGEKSQFQEGCFPPCLCPSLDQVPARGTMVLAYEGNVGGIETYAVRDVNFGVPVNGVWSSVTGNGVYRIGSPGPATVLEHRLELDLRVGDDEVARFDSGWAVKEAMDHIVIKVSINQMYCWDRVFDLNAHPVPPGDIVRYALRPESTFQRGCWDPCDCPPGPELPMTGSFDLVPLSSNSFLREFAVLNVDWQVVSPDVANAFRLRGLGLYWIREEFAIQHRMVLGATVNDEPAARFDSGWVVGGGAFPSIATLLSVNGLECMDTALRVSAEPADGLVCGGIAGLPCPQGQFCKLLTGRCCCDFMGLCAPMPQACQAVWDPVCGCDGVTYGNECDADARGVSIDHYGPCAIDCRPRDDRFGCEPVACSDVPEIQCIGTVLELDVATGAVYTAACECLDFNVCHVEFGNASPFAVGYCPGGQACEVVAADTNGDGQPDWFTAECVVRDHACCMPDGVCLMLPLAVCLVEGGQPLPGVGCEVVFCGPPEEGACCLAITNTGELGCEMLTAVACAERGGEYLGDGTACPTDPGAPCGPLDGACCLPNGDCLVLPIEVCIAEGGSPLPGVGCEVIDCAPPTAGACCVATAAGDIGCVITTGERCAAEGGEYLGDGSQCPSDPNLPCESDCLVECPPATVCTTECGVLVQGAECVLFASDSGGVFALVNLGGFSVGDHVSVTGCLTPDCPTTCMQGSGCFLNNTIEPCGAVCGGFAGIPCEDPGEFCKFPMGTCHWSDMQGICTPIPSGGCPEYYQPVCGCDGVTYGNVCESDAAGVSLLHEGPCESRCAATRVLSEAGVAYCPSLAMKVRILLDPTDGTSAIALDDAPPPGWLVSEISDQGSFDAVNGKVKWGPLFAPFPLEVSYVVMPNENEEGIRCFSGTVSLDGVNQAICGDECADRKCCTRMPADLPQPACDLCGLGDCGDCESASCGDGAIGLCELIGYACRWMRGCNDDLAGMTRAAFIWRNGECYCWNEADQNWAVTDCSPSDAGCCTSSTVAAGMSGRERDASGATAKVRPARKLRPAKAGSLTIPIVVEAPASATAMALEFYVPEGWGVISISDSGGWDALNRKIKWGPVFDNLSRTVTVEVVRVGSHVGGDARSLSVGRDTRAFTGTVSFDGVNSRVRVE